MMGQECTPFTMRGRKPNKHHQQKGYPSALRDAAQSAAARRQADRWDWIVYSKSWSA
jgi:hypothetical protein